MKRHFRLWSRDGTVSQYARCLNPRCTNRVEFREENAGQQKGYCSEACQVQTKRDYQKMMNVISNSSRYGASDPRFVWKIRWHLERYSQWKPPAPDAEAAPDATVQTTSPAKSRVASGKPVDTAWLLPLLGDRVLAKRLAGNPLTPGEVLSVLAEDADPAIRSLVASNPSTEPHALEVLGQDERPAVRKRAAGNPHTPTMARKRALRDRAPRVQLAAQQAEHDAGRLSRTEQHRQDAAREARADLRNPEVFADTVEVVLTREIAEALDLIGEDVEVAQDHIRSALEPHRGYVPALVPVAVSAERQFGTASVNLARRRQQTTKRPVGDPEALCMVPDLATWIEAFSDWITVTYDLTATAQAAVSTHVARMFDALGRTEPLTQDQVHFVPRFVRQHPEAGRRLGRKGRA